MRIGWLEDRPGYVGGAEMTAAELREAAPDGIEIVECLSGAIEPNLDVYIAHNVMLYTPDDAAKLKGHTVVRFIHDHRGPGPIDASDDAFRVFYSPLQRDRVGLDGMCIPPPLDTARFAPNGDERGGIVSIGTWGHFGKGQQYLAEWAAQNGPVNVFGSGQLIPQGPGIVYRGELGYGQVPEVLKHAETFVHLPSEVEAFGRNVAEAWFAGTQLVVNENCGCLYWLRNKPEAIETAAEDFWNVVLDA